MSEKLLYEIVNPSDEYTIVCDSHITASCCCFLLGEGTYSFEAIDHEKGEVPIFLFGGAYDWFKKEFGVPFDEYLRDKDARLKIAESLNSVLIGSKKDRDLFESAIEKMPLQKDKDDFYTDYHDRKRSSVNDIGGFAKKYAESILKGLKEDKTNDNK